MSRGPLFALYTCEACGSTSLNPVIVPVEPGESSPASTRKCPSCGVEGARFHHWAQGTEHAAIERAHILRLIRTALRARFGSMPAELEDSLVLLCLRDRLVNLRLDRLIGLARRMG